MSSSAQVRSNKLAEPLGDSGRSGAACDYDFREVDVLEIESE